MNANRLALVIAVIAVSASSGGADVPADRAVKALLNAHNRERRLKELGPLSLSAKLCEAAQIHARDMATHQTLSHTGSDGSAPADRVKRVGYVARRSGENCAQGQRNVGEVMSGWMKSPGHRANILANYSEMGASWAQDDAGIIYWCVEFGTPRSSVARAPVKPEEVAAAVVKHINRDRQIARMVLLHPEPALTRAAMGLCASMAAKDSLEAEGDLLAQVDKQALTGREIRLRLSATATTPANAATELHRDTLDQLHAFREIGVGYAVAKSGTRYWCAIFARPVDVAEPVGPP